MSGRLTVGLALDQARKTFEPLSESPGLDARVLLRHCLNRPDAWLLAHPESELTMVEGEAFHASVGRVADGEPLPYVLGWWEFYGRRFRVTPDVLIPRPETEMMVEVALDFIAERGGNVRVADVGTGSGCIAVTLGLEAPDAFVVATDRSLVALQVADQNASALGAKQGVVFVQADLLTPFQCAFDLICANLPYIPTGALQRLDVGRREPWAALDGGLDGLAHVRRLMGQIGPVLAPGGRTLIEIEASQGGPAAEAAREAAPGMRPAIRKDLAGRDRLLVLDLPR